VSVSGPEQDLSWRRLSVRMLLVYPVRELAGAIPALVGLVVAGHSVGNGQWWWGPFGVVGVIVLSVLRWPPPGTASPPGRYSCALVSCDARPLPLQWIGSEASM
jgi:hypothetical protein